MSQNTFMSSILSSVGGLFFKGKDQEARSLADLFKSSRSKSVEELMPIKNKRDFAKARDTWNRQELRKLPKKRQEEFADYMIKKSDIMRMKPLSYWEDVIND